MNESPFRVAGWGPFRFPWEDRAEREAMERAEQMMRALEIPEEQP